MQEAAKNGIKECDLIESKFKKLSTEERIKLYRESRQQGHDRFAEFDQVVNEFKLLLEAEDAEAQGDGGGVGGSGGDGGGGGGPPWDTAAITLQLSDHV